ncbi:hypothetical protein TSMEX_001214 [Taenia solium]|eukprot:TsM_000205600 transcript=TsM_000205600 gene=TsM_000205600
MFVHYNSKEMSQVQDAKREECKASDGLEKEPEHQMAALDAPFEGSSKEMKDTTVPLEALIIYPEDEIRFLARIEKMLKNNYFRLKYVLCEDAIENPYVADRETQLRYLMALFYEVGLPASSRRVLEKSRNPQSLDPPHSYVPDEPQKCSTEEERSKDYHCTFCGFTFDRLDVVLFHTEQEHPTERDVINCLRLRLLRAAFDPKDYRLGNAEKKDSASSSTLS